MNGKPKIEFREGEEYCRWNGILMDSKGKFEEFGIDFEEIILFKGRLFIYLKNKVIFECTEDETIKDAIIYLLDMWSYESIDFYCCSGHTEVGFETPKKINFSKDLINDIHNLKLLDWMNRQIIDLEKLHEFATDLNAYYEV